MSKARELEGLLDDLLAAQGALHQAQSGAWGPKPFSKAEIDGLMTKAVSTRNALAAAIHNVAEPSPPPAESLWIMKAPVLSRFHLEVADELWLAKAHEEHWASVEPFVSGWLAFVENRKYLVTREAPDGLMRLFDWARGEGFNWVRFDLVGDILWKFPTYGRGEK